MSLVSGPSGDYTLNRERRPLWDTLVVGAGATGTLLTMFALPFSGTKARHLTNLPRPYQIGPGEHFTCRSIRIMPVSTIGAADAQNFEQWALQLYINNVLRTEGPVPYFPAGGGTTLHSDVAAGVSIAMHNGLGEPICVLDPAIEFSGDDQVRVDLIGASFVAVGFTVKVILDGEWDSVR